MRKSVSLARAKLRCAGLTLLEMLVVLVITALLSTLVVQGLGYFLARYEGVNRLQQKMLTEGVPEAWFASTVAGLVALPSGPRTLRGDGDGFEGTTMSPLAGEPGLSQQFSWSIARDDGAARVDYSEGRALRWALWTSMQALTFEYADQEGRWHDSWPLEGPAAANLPSMIRLVRGESGETLWLAQTQLSPIPVPNFREEP